MCLYAPSSDHTGNAYVTAPVLDTVQQTPVPLPVARATGPTRLTARALLQEQALQRRLHSADPCRPRTTPRVAQCCQCMGSVASQPLPACLLSCRELQRVAESARRRVPRRPSQKLILRLDSSGSSSGRVQPLPCPAPHTAKSNCICCRSTARAYRPVPGMAGTLCWER